MAANSGGVDWSTVIKPLLSSNYGNLNKADVLNIIKAILRSENDFAEHDYSYEQFYMTFSALAADTISGQCHLVCQTQVPQMIEASSVLIHYMLNRLWNANLPEIKWFLIALKSLCEGKQQTQGFDHAVISSVLKSSKYPEHNKSNVTASDKESPKSEMKRSRSDLSTVILQQLTVPLNSTNSNSWAPLSEDVTDCTQMFVAANIACMQSLNAGDVILNVCTSLPVLSRYRLKYEDSATNGKPLYLPLTPAEATQVKNCYPQMSTDISILAQALTLPVLEPITPTKITQLSQCAMSALYCAVLASISGSVLSMSGSSSQKNPQSSASSAQVLKEADENEDHARVIVDKALEIYTTIGNIFKNSARAHIYQNHLCFGSWLLITGIQSAMGASGSSSSKQQQQQQQQNVDDATGKGKSPAKGGEQQQQQTPTARVNLFKVQQGFGVLNAAIASHCLVLLKELIEDLKIESRSGDDNITTQQNQSSASGTVSSPSFPEPAGFDILEQYTSLQRVIRVLNSATLQQLLTFLATVSYRKACTLKRVNAKDRTEGGDPISYSDSTTYFNDTLSCSEDSETEEEDSESYLGLWFKETLSPEANEEPPESNVQEKTNEIVKSNLVPAKDEPHEYLDLSAQIFSFLDQSLGTNHKFLNKYVKSGLSEQQMILLANILKDLDRDAARGEPENLSCPQWQNAMIKFSGALGRYLHNLISGSLLNESLQSSLLLHLGVSPWTQDSNLWPLQVYSRTLSVLVQIILLKPTQEKEAACLSVWHRLVNTLVEGVCSSTSLSTTTTVGAGASTGTSGAGAGPSTQLVETTEYEDLNVEHAQLLLFLFHSLNLMQKKSILLLTAGGVIRCAEVCRGISPERPLRDNQLMLLSRLLLFLEYLMKHLYNAPTVLLEQVRWNLFSVITADGNQKISDLINNKTKMMSFCRKEIEDKHKKFSPEYSTGIRPKFYSLAVIDTKVQQEFKLDGLAWNFILCTPDKLKYPLLVDALIDILHVTDICMAKVPFHTLCSVHYCFSLCWKLLLGLPPSTPHVEALMQDKTPNLHSLIWSIRCFNPMATSHYLIVNSLIKQGMYTQYAETLWNKVTEHVSDIRYSLKITLYGLEAFNKSFNSQNPRLSKILLLDALVSHMHALCWADKEGIRPTKSSSSTNTSTGNAASNVSGGATAITTEQDTTNITNGSNSGTANTTNNAATPTGTSSTSVTTIVKSHAPDLTRDDLSKELLLKLLEVCETIRDCIFKTMIKNLSGSIPLNLMENLIAITSSQCTYCTDISTQFLNSITAPDKEIITIEWRKNLNIGGEESFSTNTFPVEIHTLSVIDNHLSETSKHSSYSILLSLKHTLKSCIYLMYYLLSSCKNDRQIIDKVTTLLIPLLTDIRTEYVYDISKFLNLEMILNNDIISMGIIYNIYRHSYKLILDYCEESRQGKTINLDENVLHTILKFWETMLDKPIGQQSMQEFFCINKHGSLVEMILSFTNTQMSQSFATKVLQFLEKLFQCTEKSDSKFTMEQLSVCIAELGQIDIGRIKNWLHHILLGPGSATSQAQASSGSSSNAQTPTNMATVSAIPSISDQIVQSSEMVALEDDAMEIDLECSGAAAVGASGGAANSGAAAVGNGAAGNQSLSGQWQGNSFLTNRSDTPPPNEECTEKNGRLLQSITKYIVAEIRIPLAVSENLFHALIRLGSNLLCPSQDLLDFTDLLQVMVTLADAAHGKGHSLLFTSAIDWLHVSQYHVLDKTIAKQQQQMGVSVKNNNCGKSPAATALENVTSILRYMGDLLHGLGYKGSRSLTPPWEEEMQPDFDDLMDDIGGDDDESTIEDSDEDSLGNKLCTFSQTQKEFMNQHWYHCHTCNMVNTVGVCSVCARVCHKNHDVSYAKYGNFFCDCGAKEDGSCQALSRRINTAASNSTNHQDSSGLAASAAIAGQSSSSAAAAGAVGSSAHHNLDHIMDHNYGNNASGSSGAASTVVTKRRTQTPPSQIATNGSVSHKMEMMMMNSNERALYMAKVIEASKEQLNNPEQWKSVIRCILEFFELLMPSIRENCALFSTVGCHRRAKAALERLHQPEKQFQLSDQIMLPTLGSQEGAFENVRMSYSGEQGQTIKQLLSSGLVRRVALCCLSSPHGKRQHLAVSHEKGKVTILQLSALLKQADAAKRKLTLTQLSSAPIPCTVLSLTANPSNEDCLAVCGLKECHILTFSSNGAANEHIVLTPQLETGNFIKRAIWLPGSQTKLALVTADFVKIYELSEDTYSPQYYFLVAVGKIRDCTFVYQEGTYYMLLIASSGYIYYQPLDEQSLAKHGDFYVTNTLELNHPHIKDISGQIGGGGVSIYYSHSLQMLFFSYSLGRSFMAPLTDVSKGVKCVIQLQTAGSGGSGNGGTTTANATKNSSKGPPQPLCQWTEIQGHPGLIFAMMHTTNNPVIFMLKPDCILMQEIKAQSSKSKIMDMVAIRHTVSGVEKTTLILLCEDGSLRIFTADQDNTNYWLSSEVQPIGNQMYSTYATASTSSFVKSSRKSKKSSGSRHQKYGAGGVQSVGQGASSTSGATGANPIFPIDFFEHCTVMPDIEFGGNDLLQIYNVQKLKTRLFSSGMYVASTKPNGFTLDINNPDPNMVITGIRVLIGTQDILRAPQSVSILGRTIQTPVRRPRWFDIPLTREESLQSDKKLSVIFGRSQDPENVCMLDSVEVYGKTKDVFGWPEETEENSGAGGSGGPGGASSSAGATAVNGSSSAGGSGQQGMNNVIGGPGGSNGVFSNDINVQTVTLLDKMVTTMLEVLDSGLSLLGGSNVESTIKQKSVSIATDLLLLPTPNPVQIQTKCVLATLHGNRIAYHSYKDKEILNEVNSELKKLDNLDDIKDIDPEAFYRLVLLTRGIAVSRPQALTKICTEHNLTILPLLLKLTKKLYKITPAIDEPCSVVKCGLSHTETIVHCLVEIIYAFALSDSNQIDEMTKYFVELLLDPSKTISHSAKEAMILLMNPRVKRRKVVVGSPPGCSTPTPVTAGSSVPPPPSSSVPSTSTSSSANAVVGSNVGAASAAAGNDDFAGADVDAIEPIGIEVGVGNPQALASLEALLGVGGFPQLLDLQQDADDEAIMDIAIALSLQEHEGGDLQAAIQGIRGAGAAGRALQNLQALGGGGSIGDNASGASGGGSDDEGSNAATDGSTLRTSPAEHAGSGSGSGGSESGGSGVESIGGTSGRSSTYGDQPINPSPPRNETQMQSTSTAAVAPAVPEVPSNEENEDTTENENTIKLHSLRCSILSKIIENFKLLDECNGNQAIPLMQVVLMLTTDLDGNHESDQNALNQLLNALVERLEMDPPSQASQMTTRTPKTEVKVIILCLISILVGKTKSSSSKTAGTTSPPHQFKDNASFVAGATANILMKSGAIPYCLVLMESFLPYWKSISNSDDIPSAMNAAIGGAAANISNALSNNSNNNAGTSSGTGNNLLKPVTYGPKPDITSLIPQNYIKNHSDIFEAYNLILTEIAVRLPYQVLKLSSGHPSTYDWYHKFCETMTFILCEYMMLTLSPILRRQVRKLLMYICGNKEKFRLFRDGHSLDVHIHAIKKCCDLNSSKVIGSSNQPNLTYDGLVELTEHLRACQEVATVRTGNWQRFCVVHEDVIPSLIQICCYQLDDGVSPIILQLLQSALCNTTTNVISNNNISSKQTQTINDSSKSSSTAAPTSTVSTVVKNRQERDKSEESECTSDSKFDPAHCSAFVHQIFRLVPDQLFTKFINIFLLETNITSVRWQTHSLIYAIYENSNDKQKERLIKILWDMWPILPAYGRRISQFVDILGYLTLSTKTIQDKLPEYTEKAVTILQQQNELLLRHPNAPIYTALGQVLELDGFYLESEPCLVCNNPEVPMSNIKIQTIKSDSKFTTTTMIVKLVQCHTISKIILRIADLKRTKMVRTINVYYNNRTVQAVVELKNKPSMWHKARKVTLQSGQTDVKIDFPLPITACNLMIEYADFYETVTGSSESLQCPRCSAAVPAYPGVCGNCGENVFQCHKCRAINYDEKDPFLCHSCGFCKYAKFDYSIYGRACCAVDPIESAEDRTKTVQTIHSSLEKADRIYRQLQANKQFLELLIQKISEHKLDRTIDESIGTVVTSSQVNKVIQLLAQKYCVESKTSFEELSKVVQKVKACRRELVAYDRSQMDLPSTPSEQWMNDPIAVNRCYGCALASTEQCLTLLRAMASNLQCRIGLCEQGLVEELAQNNLRRGTTQIQEEVRQLLCLLTRDLPDACRGLLSLIRHRVEMALNGVVPLANLDIAVRHEMALLESLNAQDDSCWELKLKVVFELFLMACKDSRGPAISVIQPCLRIIQSLICPPLPTSTINKDLTAQELTTLKCIDGLTADFRKWLGGDERHSYAAWRARMPQNIKSEDNLVKGGASAVKTDEKLLLQSGVAAAQQTATSIPPVSSPSTIIGSTAGINDQQQQQQKGGQRNTFVALLHQQRMQTRRLYLIEKYGRRWRNSVLSKGVLNPPLELTASWLQPVLFNTNSRFGRQLACALITSLSRTHERRREILNLLTDFLKYVGEVGEASAEFLALYRSLADETPWKQYLSLKGVLTLIANLLTVEIEKIHRLEETTLSSDLAQGYALRQLVELMSVFLENAAIRQAYKTKLLGPVLQGYLSLRKLVVQRTRLIDDAQEKLLEMLEEMTSGTEEETRGFMAVLIDTVQKTPLNDIKTPVFIFERLYSIIHPEENDDGEFFLTLEKDPQQEDFLQGRMLGNPYPSTEAGLGPLMRDVKNKICTDCELIALLEDDNGMELLVNNKIISLDLPVKEVYKRIWLAEGGERDAMRVVYRMRGLLGDATEEFVETLNNKSQEEVDNEQLYRMANVLADCNGLKVMLDRISNLQNISRTRELVQVLLKLFLLSVKVRRCQEVLCQPELGAINILLKVLQMCLQSENDQQQSSITEQLLEIMETILSKAASDTLDSFLQFSLTFGGPEYVTALISCTNHTNVRNNPSVLRHLIRVLAALVYGNEVKMALLCEHFKGTLDFNKFDAERTNEDEFKMELFCVLTNQIEHNSIGGTLKDYIIGLGIVGRAIEYIEKYAPCVKPTLLRTDSDELKEFISRPSLKYILRFLTGLATKHEATQIAVSKDIIPIIHRLEQVSSDEHVGSLAENLLEALCTDPVTAKRVQEVREFTRAEKKRLAMATRVKQLDALGMRTNEKGQVTAKGSILQKIEKLRDETGLTCFICREGYACQPSKVLGIYTFTKRTNVEEFELKPRKTLGYTTVTHFNVVHVDCHTSAIRLARGRDEWERASLQNANTRCNGLLPLWGPDVSESAFSTCMTRHSSYMQESTQRCDITFSSSIHDLKLLLMRFAWEKSFHEDAGGGGPQSNMHLVPYLLFYSLYMLLSLRTSSREDKALTTYLSIAPSEKWLENSYEVEGPLYQISLSLALHSHEVWNRQKIIHLKRLLIIAQSRHISPNVVCKALLSASDRQMKEYNVYKAYLMMWGLIDLIYRNLFKTVTTPKEEDWPISLFDYIRRNDEAMLKSTDTILTTFTEEYLPCTSFAEFCDVAGLLNDIENPDGFLNELLQSMPTTSSA